MTPEKPVEKKEAPRLRLASHVDLSKANTLCTNCGGSGVVRYEELEERGEQLKIPVICKCVIRNNGVQRDMLDKMIEDMHEQVVNGTFVENLTGDIMRLPEVQRKKAVGQIWMQMAEARKSGDKVVAKQLQEVVARINLLRSKEN